MLGLCFSGGMAGRDAFHQDLLDQTDEELLEAMEDEVPGVTPAERLENQLIAVLNLDRDDDHQVTASTSLDDASSFFMELISSRACWERTPMPLYTMAS